MMNQARYFLLSALLSLSPVCFAAVPGMLDVTVGGKYPFPVDWSKVSPSRPTPTEQFKAPNHGPYSELFPEYQVSVLRETNQIAFITAERVMVDLRQCTDQFNKLKDSLANHFTDLRWNANGRAFESETSNEFFKIGCTRSGGSPFWVLEYQARGKEQDSILKAAWEKYLGR